MAEPGDAVLAARARRVAALLRLAGEPTRLHIIWLLADREHFVGELCAATGGSQPAISSHLEKLLHARVVERQRKGQRSFYALTGRGRMLASAAAGVEG